MVVALKALSPKPKAVPRKTCRACRRRARQQCKLRAEVVRRVKPPLTACDGVAEFGVLFRGRILENIVPDAVPP